MKIILLKDMKNRGKIGEIMDIADGYGRNYLIPRGWAQVADEKTIQIVAAERQKTSDAAKFEQKLTEKLAKKLSNLVITFVLPADGKGHLYAGLKESEIFAKISKGEASLSADQVRFPDFQPLKSVGEHKIRLKVQDKFVEIKVIIHPVKSSAANEKGQKKR